MDPAIKSAAADKTHQRGRDALQSAQPAKTIAFLRSVQVKDAQNCYVPQTKMVIVAKMNVLQQPLKGHEWSKFANAYLSAVGGGKFAYSDGPAG